jgi:hypothetical protein
MVLAAKAGIVAVLRLRAAKAARTNFFIDILQSHRPNGMPRLGAAQMGADLPFR